MNEMSMLDEALVGLFDSPGYQVLAVLAAFGIGAAHAVAPGHGKAVTAAYLVGTRGNYRHAAALGGVVALMHTFSAIVLAVGWVSLSAVASIGTPVITGVLQALAGVLVIGVGVQLIRTRHAHSQAHRHAPVREPAHHGHEHEHPRAPAHSHSHSHSHSHDHSHPHAHDHLDDEVHASAHAQQIEAVGNPFSRRGLVALGLSGGLVPSPSSFLVLVSGMLTGQIVFALLLVGVFGIGMAFTLTLVGVVTLRGTALLHGSGGSNAVLASVSQWLPVLAAYAVVAGGVVYLTLAVRTLI